MEPDSICFLCAYFDADVYWCNLKCDSTLPDNNSCEDFKEAAGGSICPTCGDDGYIIVGSSADEGRHIKCPKGCDAAKEEFERVFGEIEKGAKNANT